jgi:hypothetical protein
VKKFILPTFIFLLLLYPALCLSAYLIHFSGGGKLATPRYWEEKGSVYFYYKGGVAGVEKENINKIERYVDIDGGQTVSDTASENKDDTVFVSPETKKTKQEETPLRLETIESSPSEIDTKKDADILKEFKSLQKRYELRESMTVAELTDLKNDLTTLRDKIISNKMEDDFLEESDKIRDMRFFINDILIIKTKRKK